jgi:2-polyprenyl-3-methyl-5-hydroxy-6-metoxy-1,4-benzoquinol methylase
MDRDRWNERYAAQPLLWNVDPGPFLGGEVGGRPPGHALDLGAGEGRTALWLAEHGWTVTAVDFSDVALDRGRQRAEDVGVGGQIEWICADLLEFDPAGGAYDLVLMMFVHLRQPPRRRLLRAAAGALAPGGMVLIAGYDSRHRTEGQGGVRDPEILFTPEDLVADLDGLRIERAESMVVGEAVDAIVRAVRD